MSENTASEEYIRNAIMSLSVQENVPKALCERIVARCLKDSLTEKQVDYLALNVFKSYEYSKIVPSEAVGVVAAQSIGEPGTQMSIPGSEKVIISQDGFLGTIPIGTFVDNLLACAEPSDEEGTIDVLDIPEGTDYFVPSLGRDEKVHWNRIRQVSRHDPNGEILKVITRSGRQILATKSHSFITRKGNTIVVVEGRTLTLGDRIPALYHVPGLENREHLAIRQYIPEDEAWYGSEMAKVKRSSDRLGRKWKSDFNRSYKVPVEVDALRVAFKTRKDEVLEEGFVYPKMFHGVDMAIPEMLPLDFLFGWFTGAYLAEGSNAGTFISITNIDDGYINLARQFAERFSINTRLEERDGEFGPSKSIQLSSSLLSRLFEEMCGKGADNKRIPDWVFNAPDECIKGVLQAYFDGDGSFSEERSQIRASSNSKMLRDGICLLLTRVGIFTKKYTEEKQYVLRIQGKYAAVFKERIGSIMPSKLASLNRIIAAEELKEKTYDVIDMIPGFDDLLATIARKLNINGKSALGASIRKYTRTQEIGRQTLERYIELFAVMATKKRADISQELSILTSALSGDAIWDQIVSIELIESPTPFVYDFSVEGDENFTTSDGIVTHNTLRTFHYAGVREMSVTQGLPRLIELVDARRNPKTPVMYIYLDKEFSDTEENSRKIHKQIEETRIEKIAREVDIDLAEEAIVVHLDREMIADKGIDVEDTLEKIKKFKKTKVTHEVDGDDERIVITISSSQDKKDEEVTIPKLQKLREKIMKKIIQGIKGIKRGIIDTAPGKKEFRISTEGTNLEKVLLVDGVDKTRTYCNDLHETMEQLGIEAARNLLIRESRKVLDDQSLDVDIRHLMLTADLMTHTGDISQIGRHGISGTKESVLARAAFEVTIKQLIDASVIGEADQLKGIPENVIVGQLCPVGTGDIQLYYDWRKDVKRTS
nr:DNA-directed RNA polymerase subunit A'' [Candidatus Sigynarchaeum springense]